MTRPLIGVSTSEVRHPMPQAYGEPPYKELALGLRYPAAIERAGGVPLVIPPLLDLAFVPDLLAGLSGLVLSGGPDIDPLHYHQRPHAHIGETFAQLDLLELALLHEAARIDLPVLGVCRGHQMINVFYGGTLYQDLPSDASSAVRHRSKEVSGQAEHTIHVTEGSQLARVVEQGSHVNSFHHQAIHQLGQGLVVSATAPDGIIEAVEDPTRSLLLGVQWHPEALQSPRKQSVFSLLVKESLRYRRAHS
jgi:putative glutamine amidotransferase